MNKLLINIFAVLLAFSFQLQGQVLLHPNRGQWQQPIDYLMEMDAGYLYIEQQGLTYNLFDYHSHHEVSEVHQNEHSHEQNLVKQHVVKTHFVGSQPPTKTTENKQVDYYRNYFLGNDSLTWKSNVHAIQALDYENIYPGIHVNYSSNGEGLKYSFTVQPHVDPSQLLIEIEGAEHVFIDEEGNLIVKTRFGYIKETRPTAWTLDENGQLSMVDCKFQLSGNRVSFHLGEYIESQTLIIDPQLTFSTFTGATSDNWGYTACPDEFGNLYAGGIVFGVGYPVTVGSYDLSFNGGNPTGTIPGFDISITKFNQTGTQNLFSTFFGGSGNETPNSIVTNQAGDLFLLSTTSSIDFPVSTTAVQPLFSGGSPVVQTLFFNGSDLAIARMSADGTILQGSTYLGGTENDGLNYGSDLKYNYGDAFRGEIIVDENSNVYFSSSTHSADFPIASATGVLQGTQDAIYGKLNPDLSAIEFCNYFGNEGFETGNSIQLSPLNELYITGGTSSDSLSFNHVGYQDSLAGITDAYVIRVDATVGTVLNGTYLGTELYDQAYFVQVDLDNNVYVLGQTRGIYPITTLFGVPNAKQFIHKLSQDLTTSLWSTTIGSGIGNNEISPTAFLVSDCFDIYISGWGGVINSSNSLASQSSSNGFPLTADAYQSTTNGSNFYIAVLARDADSLKYGTYMGGLSSSFNHVDGGTSRFDKDGTIYHAVCGSCGISTTGFTVTPGVWSTTAPSSNCNLAAFKFNLNTMTSTIGNTDQYICFPDPVVFQNYSSFGNQYLWNFGDDSTSTEENPTHAYATPGTYMVQLIVIDTNNCYHSDTSYFEIVIDEFVGDIAQLADPVCPNVPFQLEASGGYEYHWSPAVFLDDSLSATPMATISSPTTFQVIVIDSCGIDTLSVFVDVYTSSSAINGDTAHCLGDSIPIMVDSTQLQSIQWLPSTFFENPSAFSTMISVNTSQTISAEVTTSDGCPLMLTHFISVDTIHPTVTINDTTICDGAVINLSSSVSDAGGSYSWIGYPTVAPTLNSINPTTSTTYTVVYQLYTCISSDSATVSVNPQPQNLTITDTTICDGNSVNLQAEADIFGGVFTWTDGANVLTNLTVSPNVGIHYFGVNYALNGCFINDSMRIEVLPQPTTLNLVDTIICSEQTISLSAQPDILGGIFTWLPSNETTPSISITPAPGENVYSLIYNLNGCIFVDSLTVSVNPQPQNLSIIDTTICNGNSVNLQAEADILGGIFTWTNGTNILTNLTVAPNVGIHYFGVNYVLNGCFINDSMRVEVLPQPSTLNLVDTIICSEQTISLTSQPDILGGIFTWLPGNETSPSISITPAPGENVYSLIYNLNGCIFEDSITVSVNPQPQNLTITDTTICDGNSVNLQAGADILGGVFTWTNGTNILTNLTVAPNVGIHYFGVNYALNGCFINDSMRIEVLPQPTTLNLVDTIICSEQTISLSAQPDIVGGTFTWLPGNETTPSISITPAPGENVYSLIYNLNGCIFEDSLTVSVSPQPQNLFIIDTTICDGNSVNLQADADILGGVFTWTDGANVLTNLSVAPNVGIHYFGVNYVLNGCFINDSMRVEVLPQPTTVNLANATICEDSMLTLIATPDVLGGTFYWNHSGETSAQVVVSPSVGLSYYSLNYDVNGCSFTDSVSVITHPYPLLESEDYAICSGEEIQLSINPSIPNGGYLWSINNQTSPTITVSPAITSSYSVNYAVNGCNANAILTVEVNALPTGVFASDSVCENMNVHSQIILDSAQNDTFVWTINGIEILSNSSTFNDTIFTSEGMYEFTVTVSSDVGCATTFSGTSIVYPTPIAYFSNQVACLNQLALFEDQSYVSNQYSANSIVSWQWSFPPSTISLEQNPSYYFQTAGNAQVGLEVTSNHGCVADTLLPVYVEPIPVAEFEITSVEGCSPVCVEISALPETNSDISISNYTWYISDGTTINGASSTLSECFSTESVAKHLDITLSVSSSNGCVNSFGSSGLISVYPNAVAYFQINPAQPTYFDSQIYTTNLSSVSTVWQWTTSFNGNSTDQHPQFEVPDVSANNEILLIANNQFDCPDTFSIYFDVKAVDMIYVPNTFTPDGESSNSIFIPVFSPHLVTTYYHFLVFNRWGEVVFETYDPLVGWDGTYVGKVAQDGTYTWKIDYSTATEPEKTRLVGHVNLLR